VDRVVKVFQHAGGTLEALYRDVRDGRPLAANALEAVATKVESSTSSPTT
jgi:hypothetical protein